jgi:hypothetical protein
MVRGTYIHMMPFHLFRYLDEEAFRFNERKKADDEPKKDGERFLDVVRGVVGRRVTYAKLTGKPALA